MTCGCLEPANSHNDPRNIVYKQIAEAATAADITVDEAVANVNTTVELVARPDNQLADILSRPLILSDIDGVLGFFTETIVTALNAHFDLHLLVSEMTEYWIEDTLDTEQSAWLLRQFNRSIFYENVAPDYSAIAALNAIHKGGYDLLISSDRPMHTRPGTVEWLDKWRIECDEVILKGRDGKKEILASHGIGNPAILFDDDPAKFLSVAREGVEVWSPSRPWTPTNWENYPYVWVFHNWTEVLDRLGLPTDVPIPNFSRFAGPANTPQGVSASPH